MSGQVRINLFEAYTKLTQFCGDKALRGEEEYLSLHTFDAVDHDR